MATRPDHYRQPPLEHQGSEVKVTELDGDSTRVYSAPGYQVFIERMWHGEYQQVPVDPAMVPALVAALKIAQGHAEREHVDA